MTRHPGNTSNEGAEELSQRDYEKERRPLDYRANIESRKENTRQRHEWKLMLADKLSITVLVLVISVVATTYGNVMLEKYKGEKNSQHAKSSIALAASGELWIKLKQCQRTVDDLKDQVRQLKLDRDLTLLNDHFPSDKINALSDEKALKTKFNEFSNALDDRELDLGPELYARFRGALLDLAMLNRIYEDRSETIIARQPDNKFGDAAEKSAQVDLESEKRAVSNIVGALYRH